MSMGFRGSWRVADKCVCRHMSFKSLISFTFRFAWLLELNTGSKHNYNWSMCALQDHVCFALRSAKVLSAHVKVYLLFSCTQIREKSVDIGSLAETCRRRGLTQAIDRRTSSEETLTFRESARLGH